MGYEVQKNWENESVTDDCTITILFRDDPEFSGSLLSKTLGAFMRNSIYVYYENQQSIYRQMDGWNFKTQFMKWGTPWSWPLY